MRYLLSITHHILLIMRALLELTPIYSHFMCNTIIFTPIPMVTLVQFT